MCLFYVFYFVFILSVYFMCLFYVFILSVYFMRLFYDSQNK